jgi:hypothetical protein
MKVDYFIKPGTRNPPKISIFLPAQLDELSIALIQSKYIKFFPCFQDIAVKTNGQILKTNSLSFTE